MQTSFTETPNNSVCVYGGGGGLCVSVCAWACVCERERENVCVYVCVGNDEKDFEWSIVVYSFMYHQGFIVLNSVHFCQPCTSGSHWM